jgi:hypothetical protein
MLYEMSRHAPSPQSASKRNAHKTRMTFRVQGDLADALRQLPNQTAFVERTLREALGQLCPLCHGTGQAPGVHLAVSDLKRTPIGRIDRSTAVQLKALVRLGRQLLATQLELEAVSTEKGLEFRLEREDQLLLEGIIPPGQSELALGH